MLIKGNYWEKKLLGVGEKGKGECSQTTFYMYENIIMEPTKNCLRSGEEEKA
jgi:hypothetical protein